MKINHSLPTPLSPNEKRGNPHLGAFFVEANVNTLSLAQQPPSRPQPIMGCDVSADGVCWMLAVVVVGVLLYLACCELRKPTAPLPPPPSSQPTAARRAVSARAAKREEEDSGAAHDAAPARRSLLGANVEDAFEKVDVDASMVRVVPEGAYAVPDDVFLSEFHDADASTFRPVNKEAAMKSANTRPSQQMQSGRSDGAPPSRVVGLAPMEFARRTIQRPRGEAGACASFNGSDAQHNVGQPPVCGEDGCPWA